MTKEKKGRREMCRCGGISDHLAGYSRKILRGRARISKLPPDCVCSTLCKVCVHIECIRNAHANSAITKNGRCQRWFEAQTHASRTFRLPLILCSNTRDLELGVAALKTQRSLFGTIQLLASSEQKWIMVTKHILCLVYDGASAIVVLLVTNSCKSRGTGATRNTCRDPRNKCHVDCWL